MIAIVNLLTRASEATGLPESPWVLVGTALVVALLLVVPRPIWRFTGLAVTIVHELGHGFAGLLTGRRAVTIRLAGDHSGLTTSKGQGASVPWTTFWGYPAPAAVGAALVVIGILGRAGTALAVCVAVLLISLVFMRGVLAWLVVPLTGAVLVGLLALAPDPWLTSTVVGLGLFLVCGAVRALLNLISAHARGRSAASDARILHRETGVPAVVWLLLMTVVIAACAAGAGWAILEVVPTG